MQSYCKVYQIYKDNYNMVQLPVMWIGTILRKLQVHMRYKSMVWKVATLGGEPQGRPNMESRDTHWNVSLRTLTTLRNLIVEKLVPILKREERRGNTTRVVTLKNSRKPNHPPSMERLRRGKKQKFGYSA
jgi:hypothetical protein